MSRRAWAGTIVCPCCEVSDMEVFLLRERPTNGEPLRWELEDWEPVCECHGFLDRIKKLDEYTDRVLERALEKV